VIWVRDHARALAGGVAALLATVIYAGVVR
jgi:hypothetical protein